MERLSRRDLLRATTGLLVSDRRLTPKFTQEIQKPKECFETEFSWSGFASYYTESGCLGCNGNLLMANGQRLNDSIPTLAFMRTALNSLVEVINLENGLSTTAQVTDRGGFESYGRIADLNLATARAIGFNFYRGLTNVAINLLDCE